MAHNLDTDGSKTAFVSARKDAWHQLGVTLPDEALTAEQAMEHGLLGGWNVQLQPVLTMGSDGELLTVPRRNAVVRTSPFTGDLEAIGDVGTRYTIIQNEEHASFLNALVDEGGAVFDTAGAIDGGRKVFITMKLRQMLVGGVDRVDLNLAAINSHDGSMPFTLLVTPTRIVCQNTLTMALGTASRKFTIRHTRRAMTAIEKAREALDITFKYAEDFEKAAEQLVQESMTHTEFTRMIEAEFGAQDDAPAHVTAVADRKLLEMEELFADAQTQEGIRGTKWAGYNALTEWYDHFSPVRGDDRANRRAVNTIFDTSFKDRALELVQAV